MSIENTTVKVISAITTLFLFICSIVLAVIAVINAYYGLMATSLCFTAVFGFFVWRDYLKYIKSMLSKD